MATHSKGEVLSIGLDSRGASVMRVRFATGTEVDVHINVQDFAKLAASGVRVYNEFQRNPK